MLHRVLLLVTVATLLVGGCSQSEEDARNAATDSIIEAWVEAWMAEDVDGVTDLYAEDGTYADIGCPFEMHGRPAIRDMVAGHLVWTDYTVVERVETTYTDSGAVVQWVWEGTNDLDPFTMEPSTTFEIANGLIVRSTDAYERSECASWLGAGLHRPPRSLTATPPISKPLCVKWFVLWRV